MSSIPSTPSSSAALDRISILNQINVLQQRLAIIEAAHPKKNPHAKSTDGPLPAALAAQPKRHIALKFVYDGWAHSGLAYQPPSSNPSQLSTVESCLLKALTTARLIEPMSEGEGFGCGFERCGRTDAGVSSSAQVINLWVRSDLKDPMGNGDVESQGEDGGEYRGNESSDAESETGSSRFDNSSTAKRKPPSTIELPYVAILNRHLPSSIRVLAWSPVSASFSSRYSCIWRHYKYFFSTSPTDPFLKPRINPGSAYKTPASSEPAQWQKNLEQIGWEGLDLDVDRMRDAVKRLVGDHDFRNLCKVDPPKQLQTHRRTVISATIDPVEGEGPDMFVLNLRGGAFLYNQVRHIVALLFMVGARLESPSVIDQLLWTSERSPTTESMHTPLPGETREVMDRKPSYGMADDLPLVLWECGYNNNELDWRIDNTPRSGDLSISPLTQDEENENTNTNHHGAKIPLDPITTFKNDFLELNQIWTQQRLKSIIVKHHLSALATHCPPPPSSPPTISTETLPKRLRKLFWIPFGAGIFSKSTSYTSLMNRRSGDLPEEVNKRWAEGRGKAKMEKRARDKENSDKIRAVNLAIKAEAARLAKEEQDRKELEEGKS